MHAQRRDVGRRAPPCPTQTWTFRTRRRRHGRRARRSSATWCPTRAAANDGARRSSSAPRSRRRKDGTVTAIRFYKGAGNGGTHTGSLWTSAGDTAGHGDVHQRDRDRLADGDLVDAGGRSPPARRTSCPTTRRRATTPTPPASSARPCTSGDLTAPASDNGRYLYGAAGGFPTYTLGRVELLRRRRLPARGPAADASRTASPAAGATDVSARLHSRRSRSRHRSATGWSMTRQAGHDPDRRRRRRCRRDGQDAHVHADRAAAGRRRPDRHGDRRWSRPRRGARRRSPGRSTPRPARPCCSSLFTGATPATPSVNDNGAVELGWRSRRRSHGSVTAIQFYKGAGNTGTHTGSVWSATGTRLATVTFTGETGHRLADGHLATPVALTAGQTYVVSYYAPNGHYSATSRLLHQPVHARASLTAPAGNNGRYLYGAGGGFPTGSWNSTNYFVDVVFRSPQADPSPS